MLKIHNFGQKSVIFKKMAQNAALRKKKKKKKKKLFDVCTLIKHKVATGENLIFMAKSSHVGTISVH